MKTSVKFCEDAFAQLDDVSNQLAYATSLWGVFHNTGLVDGTIHARVLIDEQVALAAAGRYLYSITGFAYTGQSPA